MRPLGVFGGMFDPIHYGHLRTAHELSEFIGLERVLFLPAGEPPHRAAPLADAATRLAMLRAAVEGDEARVALKVLNPVDGIDSLRIDSSPFLGAIEGINALQGTAVEEQLTSNRRVLEGMDYHP